MFHPVTDANRNVERVLSPHCPPGQGNPSWCAAGGSSQPPVRFVPADRRSLSRMGSQLSEPVNVLALGGKEIKTELILLLSRPVVQLGPGAA